MLFVSASDNKALLVDLTSKNVIRTYAASPCSQYSLGYSPTTSSVVLHQEKGCAAFYACHTQQVLQRSFTQECIQSTIVTSCGSFMLGGGVGGNIYVWNLLTGQLIRAFKGHFRGITCMTISADNALVVTASEDSTCKVWLLSAVLSLQAADVHPLNVFSRHTLTVSSCSFITDTNYVVTGSADKTCKVFHALSGQECSSFAVGETVSCVVSSHNTIAVGTSSGHTFLLSIACGFDQLASTAAEPISINCNGRDEPSRVVFLAFHKKDPLLLICALANGSIRAFSTLNGNPREEILAYRGKLFSVYYLSEAALCKKKNANLSKNPLDLSLSSYQIIGTSYPTLPPQIDQYTLTTKESKRIDGLLKEITELQQLQQQLSHQL